MRNPENAKATRIRYLYTRLHDKNFKCGPLMSPLGSETQENIKLAEVELL